MSKKNRNEEEEVGAEAKFKIGDHIKFGEESWIVKHYHRINNCWEIMFRSVASGVHRSISCSQLERYVG